MQNAILFVATVLIRGATWIAIAMQVGPVPVLVSIFYRFVIAALVVIAALAATGRLTCRPDAIIPSSSPRRCVCSA